MISALIFTILGFVTMELSGWFIHKYIMHGPLWRIHKTHHQRSHAFFELNDLFSLVFGTIAIILIIVGIDNMDYRLWLGVGISIYGLLYFILHDILIHRRIKWLDKPKNKFLIGILNAHKAHHFTNKKEGGVSFGLFFVPKKYFKIKS